MSQNPTLDKSIIYTRFQITLPLYLQDINKVFKQADIVMPDFHDKPAPYLIRGHPVFCQISGFRRNNEGWVFNSRDSI